MKQNNCNFCYFKVLTKDEKKERKEKESNELQSSIKFLEITYVYEYFASMDKNLSY